MLRETLAMAFDSVRSHKFRSVLTVLGIGSAGALFYGGWHWRATTAETVYQLVTSRDPSAGAIYDEAEIAGLPAPVQRYFRLVLRPGQPLASRQALMKRTAIRYSSRFSRGGKCTTVLLEAQV